MKLKSLDARLELALQRVHLGLMTTALIVEEASMVRIKVSEPALKLIALVLERYPRDILRQLASASGGLRTEVGFLPMMFPLVKRGGEYDLLPPGTKS